jgi:pantoate--beta-alanine ligase
MRRATHVTEVRDAVAAARARGGRIGFVPTMGFLHEGHLRLVDDARGRADFIVMSIFVNPLQFGPTEDLSRYPRDADGDAAKAETRGVDLLFVPEGREIYPEPPRVVVTPRALASRWEGAARPGHFEGVLTVVAKLFNIVQPDVAVFGRKDLQQAALVSALVHDLDMPLKILISPIVREDDGLALSSRNRYLSADDRHRATVLNRSLRNVVEQFANGETRVDALEEAGRNVLAAEPEVKPDYFAVVDEKTFKRPSFASDRSSVIVAARVGSTRLIDNMPFGAE